MFHNTGTRYAVHFANELSQRFVASIRSRICCLDMGCSFPALTSRHSLALRLATLGLLNQGGWRLGFSVPGTDSDPLGEAGTAACFVFGVLRLAH